MSSSPKSNVLAPKKSRLFRNVLILAIFLLQRIFLPLMSTVKFYVDYIGFAIDDEYEKTANALIL
jgi:hypothetical protein